ncbi:MAG TPA: sugar phosphate isomerase/epimerase [Tepidisphaeraceae bacterium]|nr:sugar phosphate isomerase/epimerase [Tepidisphaeraceae bacterium]
MIQTKRIGVVSSALSTDPRQASRLSRQFGFGGVLLDIRSATLNIPELSITGRRELQHIISSQQQTLIGLQMDLGPKGLSQGSDIDRQITMIDRAMEATAGVAARVLCVELGPLPTWPAAARPRPAISPRDAGVIIIPSMSSAPPEAAPIKPPDPSFVSQVNEVLSEIGRRADRYSVMLAFSSSLAGFASLEKTIRDARCPWFGIDLDPVSILRDEWNEDEVFSAIGGLICHVCARDAIVVDKRTKPAVIGQGNVDWPRFLSRLDEAGYNGFVTIDPNELPDRSRVAVAGLKYLQS